MDFGCGNGFNNGCFPGNSLFGGSWIWIIILLFICNGDWFNKCGCGCECKCKCKRKKKNDCCCGLGDNWWIWILIFFFFICRPACGPVCIPQNDNCC